MNRIFARAQDPVSCETHAIGAASAFAGGILFLIRSVYTQAPALAVASAMCFAFSMMALYSASAVYHFYPGTIHSGGVKRTLRKMDHSMIYILIAGSYTPFLLELVPRPAGVRLCIALWAIAGVGVLMKILWISAPRVVTTIIYLLMGWAGLSVIKYFLLLNPLCLALMAAGGISYSVGAVFYALDKPSINADWTAHELFHLFILAGSLFHYLAVFLFVL
jgi:hemolysin III